MIDPCYRLNFSLCCYSETSSILYWGKFKDEFNMYFKFLENVSQSLPSLEWCTDKRTVADEKLTAALPLNTLAQPDAAAKHTHTSAQRVHTLYTREETDLFVLANKFTLSSPNVCLLNYKLRKRPEKVSAGLTAFLFFFLVPRGFLVFSMTA